MARFPAGLTGIARGLLAATLLSGAVTVVPAAGTAQAETIPARDAANLSERVHSAEISFGLYALGSKAFDLALGLERRSDSSPDAVRIDTAMRTQGFLDLLMSFELTGQVTARWQDGRMLPVRYRTESDGSWSKRSIRIAWGADGLPVAEVRPPNDEDDREPVPDSLKRDTIDPTSAMIARALRPGAEPPCSGHDQIFDGRRRYNLHFEPVGPDTLRPHNRSAYSGPAFKCRVRTEPLAGYSRKYLAEWSERDEQPAHIWLARPRGADAWLPVQIEGGFRLGSVSGWIAGARINGRTWLEPLGMIRAEIPVPVTP